MPVFHGNGADGESTLGAHLEHAHFVFQKIRASVGGAFWKDDDRQVVFNALSHFHACGFAALGTGSFDPNGADGIAAPADDGPAFYFRFGHKNEGVGRRDHDGVDVGPVVRDQYTGVVGKLAFYGHANACEPMNVPAIPHVRSVQARVVGSAEFARQGTDGGGQ